MRIVFGDDRTAAHLAAGTACRRHGNKIGHLLRDINIPTNQVVIIEEVPVMMDPQGNSPGHIHRGSPANTDNTVPLSRGKSQATFLDIGLDRVLMNTIENIHGKPAGLQTPRQVQEKPQLRHHRVGHQQGLLRPLATRWSGNSMIAPAPKRIVVGKWYCRMRLKSVRMESTPIELQF